LARNWNHNSYTFETNSPLNVEFSVKLFSLKMVSKNPEKTSKFMVRKVVFYRGFF